MAFLDAHAALLAVAASTDLKELVWQHAPNERAGADGAVEIAFGLQLLEGAHDRPARKAIVARKVSRAWKARPGTQAPPENDPSQTLHQPFVRRCVRSARRQLKREGTGRLGHEWSSESIQNAPVIQVHFHVPSSTMTY